MRQKVQNKEGTDTVDSQNSKFKHFSLILLVSMLTAGPSFSEEPVEEAESGKDDDGAVETSANSSEENIETIQVIGSKDFGVELSSEKILKVPGAGNDPLRAVESLPGVTLEAGGAGRPAVRGSSPNDNYYETDYVPVGYVFHNDGNSTYNGNLIQSFELKTGAWEPRYSDAIGSVIDTRLRDPKTDAFETTIDASLLRAGVLFEGPVTEDQAFYASFRESLVHLYVDALIDDDQLNFTELPRNFDYQFKYRWQVDALSSLKFVATGAEDRVELQFPEGSDTLDRQPELQGGVGVYRYYDNQGVLYEAFTDIGEVVLSLNRLEQNIDFTIGQIIDLDAITTDYLARALVTDTTSFGEISYGLDYRRQIGDYQAIGKDQPCNNEFENCPPSYYSDELEVDGILEIDFLSSYFDLTYDLTDTVKIRPGVVVSSNDFSEETLVEPRVSLRWNFVDEYTLKVAGGQHHQWFRQYRYIAEEFGTPDLAQEKADHYSLGIEYDSGYEWAWKLEGYYKEINDLIVSNPAAQVTENGGSNTTDANYINGGIGEAFGVELLINKNFSNNWYGWLSVAYSETTRENTITGDEFKFEYDQPWIINAVANYEWGNNWEFGIKWRYQSGQLYTPVNGAIPVYPRDPNTGQPDNSQPVYFYDPLEAEINSARFPAYHRLDVRADKRWEFPSYSINLYFEVLNLYGQQNVSGYSYNRDYTERDEVYSFPEMPLPSFGVKATF